MTRFAFFYILIALVLLNCSPAVEKKFRQVKPDESGIHFRNELTPTVEFNIFNYMYYYNGGGVATGDLNGDGLVDVYFTSNQGKNKLYLNKGAFKFSDITDESNAEGLSGWATGVTMADVNGDGKLDMYISYLGEYLIYQGRNLLLINEGNDANGIPKFADKSVDFGLDLKGFSTQAAFFDYDLDGDLDMYMLNHSVHQNGTFGKSTLRNSDHPLAGDKLMRNDGNRFTDVTKVSGIYSSVIGYGLGVVVSDVNLDGWPDIYVGNDFHENDYLYINKGNGTFEESLEKQMNHTSHFSMGCDFTDFNNDAFPDLISMDMLPRNPAILKASAAEDPYDQYQFKLGFGYNNQFARNTFQLNQHDGTFSEIGLLAGVGATDWSWSTLGADFNLDGFKDIFIANGIERRSNDLDYINFITIDSIQMRLTLDMKERDMEYFKKMPQIKIPNALFINNRDSTFTDHAVDWGLDKDSYSHGAAYADLDNDGDWDLVVNNAVDEAFVYENLSVSPSEMKHNGFIEVALQGYAGNTMGLGTKVLLYTNGMVQTQECTATRGFQSAVDTRLLFGTGNITSADSLVVVWPDRKFEVMKAVAVNQRILATHDKALGVYDYSQFHNQSPLFHSLAEPLGIDFKHQENSFIEFNREVLMPHMVSAEGPACALGDINGDGLEDIFLGNGKWAIPVVYLQQGSGNFRRDENELFRQDSTYEDVDAALFDADGDGDNDLLVVSGGNEWYANSEYMQPRLYINEHGKYMSSKRLDIFLTGSVVRPVDFDKDGDTDLFIGARSVPWTYGVKPDSYLMLNDGKGNYSLASADKVRPLTKLGFVKDARWVDVDLDGDEDLAIAAEWSPIIFLLNEKGTLKQLSIEGTGLEKTEGWWNTIEAKDFDKDGDLDFVFGNMGLNSKLKASDVEPVRLYVSDFDDNGTTECVLSHYMEGKEYPFYTRDELTKQLPYLKKRYLSYQKFGEATLKDVFNKEQLDKSEKLVVREFRHVYVENLGGNKFKVRPLPKASQFSTVNAVVSDDFDKDGYLDFILAGNFYPINVQLGRYDASYGLLMKGDGRGDFTAIPAYRSGVSIPGETRALRELKVGDNKFVAAVRNNSTLLVLSSENGKVLK